jgi:hypothetical protein
MSGYQLNKSGARALGYRPRDYDFDLSKAFVTTWVHGQGLYKQP